MNFKFINRKQALGISHAEDFSNWAIAVGMPMIENTAHAKNGDVATLAWCNYNITDKPWPDAMQDQIGMFNRATELLKLDFEHCELDNSPYVEVVQSIDADARKQERYFHMIDIRPTSELGTDLGAIELVDKMMVECGCNPIGHSWIEYSPEDGRRTLQAIFEADVVPKYLELRGPFVESALADRFLTHFDETVRFYGNLSEAPWEEGYESRIQMISGLLQARFDADFGLVLCDNKTIGFLLVATHLY